MQANKPYVFKPNGNDLRKVFYYYGIEQDDKIICPFHNDNRPSCHVNFDEGIFHCFACETSGDAFSFVSYANPKLSGLQKLNLYFAILSSSKASKLKLPKYKVSKIKKVVDKQQELEIAHDYYFGLKTVNWLKENNEYKDYMAKRGFTAKTLNLCKAKLTYTSNSYPIIFPIFDMGQFKGYVCRTTNKRVEAKRKYLYNKGFSRIDTLGGDYDSDTVILCEGYMDALKLRQFGLKKVVAIFGWKITSKQIDKLKARGVKTVISALDMDKPGRDGTDYLKNFFNVVEFAYPKGVKDAGDLTIEQFKLAYTETKKLLYRSRRKSNVNTRKHKKGRKK